MIKEFILSVFMQAVMITSFVLAMMLVIEYINVQSRGNWMQKMKKKSGLQLITAAILGLIPGCLGSYTVVSLYTHNVINFAALVTAMIATSGDEAFIMFAVMPKTAIIINIVIVTVAIITGLIINVIIKQKWKNKEYQKPEKFHIHAAYCNCFVPAQIIPQLKNITFRRATLIVGLITFIVLLGFGVLSNGHDHSAELVNPEQVHQEHNHNHAHEHNHKTEKSSEKHNHESDSHWNWITITFLVLSLVALFVVLTVPEHFIKEHIWEHIFKKHLLKIFLWTIAALSFIHILDNYIDIDTWLESNIIIILIIALLVGIIPESGPHLVFLSLYISGTIPLSILIANSIVQDGHGAIPLFAESKKSFFAMKAVNLIVGAIIGGLGLLLGY